MNTSHTTLASYAVFLAASLWGLYWVPLRFLGANGISGTWAVVFVNLPAALVLLPTFVIAWRQQQAYIGYSFLIGLFAGLGLALYTVGLLYSSVIRVTMLFYLTPVWGTLIGIFWLAERVSLMRWLAIFIGFSGLFILLSAESHTPANLGDFYALLSGISWAIAATLIMRHPKAHLGSMVMLQFFATSLFALLLGALAGEMAFPNVPFIPSVWAVGIGVSVLMLLPAVYVIFWAQKRLFPGRAGLLMMSEVAVAVFSASLFIPDERLQTLEWVAVLLIIAASLIEIAGDLLSKNKKSHYAN